MNTLPISKAKATFAHLIEMAKLGSPTVITVRGEPWAMVVPLPANGPESTPEPTSDGTNTVGTTQQQDAAYRLPGHLSLAELLRGK